MTDRELGAMTSEAEQVTPPSPTLSRPHGDMAARYDVVVVGSGYGGAIAASRLARAERSVCVLERGREIPAGDFPDTLASAAWQVQVRRGARRFGRATGLFDLRAGDDLSVVVGCGLGGTSLINAGVALRPKPWVYDDRWPAELRGEDNGPIELAPYFERAERMLGSAPFPDTWVEPTKLAVLRKAAEVTKDTVIRPPINVTFADGPNAAGIEQRACNQCGDCVTGCNHRAKNTVTENYLPDAVAHGAHIFCEVSVRTVERSPEGSDAPWIVIVRDDGRGALPLRLPGVVRLRRHGRPGGRHSRIHRDPAPLTRPRPGRLPPAGPTLHGQR